MYLIIRKLVKVNQYQFYNNYKLLFKTQNHIIAKKKVIQILEMTLFLLHEGLERLIIP